ncbi:MAG: hypothetical protein JHC84_13135 [Solirubrobacteraceae bacterium]|nr:hypothetical protein [Solirubrobacteraceae bacterium]
MSRLRLAAVAAIACLAVTAAVAVAATPKAGTFKAPKGQVQRGYDLKFTVPTGGKKITNVVANVLETCSGESTSRTVTVGPGLTWAIKGGKFSGRKKESADGVTVYTTLKGSFTSATTAKGIIRQESIVAGSTCDTYELKFTAKRG